MSSLLNSAAETCSSGPGGSSYDGWTVTGVTVSLRRVGARRSFDRSLEGHPYSTYSASVANRLSTALPRVHFWSGFSGMAIKASVAPYLTLMPLFILSRRSGLSWPVELLHQQENSHVSALNCG